MVKLFCAVVGAAGSAFSVQVDESDTVDDLKDAIKKKKPNKITCDADELQLYLAKKGDAWLTENEVKGVSDTSDLKHLDAARAEINVVGLSEKDVRHQVDKYQVAAGNGPVNVLVVVPAEGVVVPPSYRLSEGGVATEGGELKRQKLEPVPLSHWLLSEGGVAMAGGELKRQKQEPVPRSKWFASDFEEVVAPLPSSPFYTTLYDAITMDEWLEMAYNGNVLNLQMEDEQLSFEETRKLAGFKYFEMDFPVLFHKSESAKHIVFVRPCYETLFDLILQNIEDSRPSVAITGNPGIGKSQFYAYCAFRLSKEPLIGRTLIINFDDRYFAFVNGNFHDLSFDQVNMYQFNPSVVRLIDGRSNKLFGWSGVSILFTSPGCPGYHEFLKASRVEYVMPPWTHTELSIAASVVEVAVDEVQRRSSSFGGIARYVFAPDPSTVESDITESISKVDLVALFRAVGAREEVSEKNYSHRLLLMHPRHTGRVLYRGFYLDFSCEEIANRLYDRMVESCYDKLTEFIVANTEDSNSGGFRGTLFEIFCHRIFSSRGAARLKGRALSDKGEDMLVNVPDTVTTVRFVELAEIPAFTNDTRLYCRPIGKTYPSIDAIYWNGKTCYLLQMTISERHGIVHAPLIKILNWCADKSVAFVFVVPDGKVGRYKRQNLLTSTGTIHKKPNTKARHLKQYVVGVKVAQSSLH